jgi:phosphoribosylamine--glycine ligase
LKILIIGGGGREHAIAWKLAQSGEVKDIIASPGNPGIARIGQCIPDPGEPIGLTQIAEREKADLTVVGPEAPLVAGIVDEFQSRGLRIVGPTRKAAQLEGSKIFAKQFFSRAGIPTAHGVHVASSEDALCNLKNFAFPVVIKADGLAAGKGVVIAQTESEAQRAITNLGPRLIIEEFLEGEEVSFIALSNGKTLVPLEASQDHKRVADGDTGPNTGGMGAYSDGRILTSSQIETVLEQVMYPAVDRLAAEGMPFRGFLYAGLMMTGDGPKVLEFNVRLGDPETQALLHRLDSGFLQALEFAAGGDPVKLTWKPHPSVCVVLAAAGYPEKPRTGDPISGTNAAEALGATVFHAGTKLAGGQLATSGGRVLGVTASGITLADAIKHAYQAAGEIHFEGMHFRRDIGTKGLSRW